MPTLIEALTKIRDEQFDILVRQEIDARWDIEILQDQKLVLSPEDKQRIAGNVQNGEIKIHDKRRLLRVIDNLIEEAKRNE